MQRNQTVDPLIQIYLPELLEDERQHPDKNRLTVEQRFQFCFYATLAMKQLVEEGKSVECLGLHGVTVNTADDGKLQVRIGSFTYPANEAAREALQNVIITTTDAADVDNEKKAVQLLGLLFIQIFRAWTTDPFSERAEWIMNGKLPVFNKAALQHAECTVDDVSETRLSQLLVNMCQFDAEKRLTLSKVLQAFSSIHRSLTWVPVRSAVTPLSPLERDIEYLLGIIVEYAYKKMHSLDKFEKYVQDNHQAICGLLPHMSACQLQFVQSHISQYLNAASQTTELSPMDMTSRESTTDINIDTSVDAEGAHVHIHRTHTVRLFGNVDPSHPHNQQTAPGAETTAAAAAAPLSSHMSTSSLSASSHRSNRPRAVASVAAATASVAPRRRK